MHPSAALVLRGLRIALGVLFLILGILGLFLPILQGILFLMIGTVLLAPHVPLMARGRDWFYQRFPASHALIERHKARWAGRRGSPPG